MTTPASASRPTIDFGKCLGFAFQDPDWIKKLLIGGLFSLLSALLIGIFFVAGYWARVLRRMAAGDARPLPEWDDLGGIFGDGVKVALAALTYGIVVFGGIAALGCLAGFLLAGAGAVGQHSREAGDALATLGGLGAAGLYCLFLVLALALHVYLPPGLVSVVLRDDYMAAFDFRSHIDFIRANGLNYLLSLLFYLVASFAAQFGVILCCVGLFPLAFWAYLVLAGSLGETVRLNPGSVLLGGQWAHSPGAGSSS